MKVGPEVMQNYLQQMMWKYKREEARFGSEDERVVEILNNMIACKEMVEALVGMPVNLQKDGRVTFGF